MLIPIPGTTLVRDTETMALINKDTTGQQEYYNRRNKMAAEKEQINKIKTEVQSLKDDVNDIKQLLNQILEKV
jgi:small-conductance mechanosensitive channel